MLKATGHFGKFPRMADIGKVHFAPEQLNQHDSEIVIQQKAENILDIHLGFLQIHHQYHVRLSVTDSLGEDLEADPVQNVHVRVLEVMPSEDGLGHELLLDLNAYKEKLMKVELVLCDCNDRSKTLKLILNARVLGKGKGTPSLRTGIHCTGINTDDDSEQSDWQGFD